MPWPSLLPRFVPASRRVSLDAMEFAGEGQSAAGAPEAHRRRRGLASSRPRPCAPVGARRAGAGTVPRPTEQLRPSVGLAGLVEGLAAEAVEAELGGPGQ